MSLVVVVVMLMVTCVDTVVSGHADDAAPMSFARWAPTTAAATS